MKLRFYGRLAELIGSEIDVEQPARCTIAELRQRLIDEHHHARDVLSNRRVRACVRDALVGDDHVIAEYETVEFLPPVSGG
ncbi:MAG TPA: MoaD/ThiS family protein [Sphingomicrobium sp.]|nr:MoaD/ThiS family protein [Sphingomicrobium sp.]